LTTTHRIMARDDPNESISKNSAVCAAWLGVFQHQNQEVTPMSNHSRRAVLAGIATAPALAGPALALSGPDPIYSAIERHKAVYAAFGAVLHGMSKFEKEKGWADSPEREVWRRREREACDADAAAREKMLATVPTTFAGVLALLRYIDQGAEENLLLLQDGAEELVSITLSALERIGPVS
jgi:hypothetical protein